MAPNHVDVEKGWRKEGDGLWAAEKDATRLVSSSLHDGALRVDITPFHPCTPHVHGPNAG